MKSSRHLQEIRAALRNLLNDAAITDRKRLRTLELIETDICGSIADLQARLPEHVNKRKSPDGGPSGK
jgi:hypothetical protein